MCRCPSSCAEHVAREAEQVAAGERGPERPREVAAEQERGPGGERRQQDRGGVVRGDRPRGQRDRREQQREPGDRRRPGEVAAVRRPEDVRDERVVAVQHARAATSRATRRRAAGRCRCRSGRAGSAAGRAARRAGARPPGRARPLRPPAVRETRAQRLDPKITACQSVSAWRRARPASSTSAACARSSSTGSSRASRAASAACGSRTRTRAARSPRRSTRSRSRCAGSGSTGTGRPRSSSTGWTRCERYAERLLAEGKAYEDEGAIRFRMPDEGVVGWDDVVRGRIEFENENLADLVIVRADGRATYNFASPVEDMLDGITHVIRGTGSRLEHADADQHPHGARRRAAGLRACPRRARRRRQEALEASRRGVDRRVPRGRLHPRGADELPRAARLELRRQDDGDDARGADRAVLARARRASPATFDYEKLDWLNGVHLRELSEEEYGDRLVAMAARAGDRLARGARSRDRAARAGEAGEALAVPQTTSASCSRLCHLATWGPTVPTRPSALRPPRC